MDIISDPDNLQIKNSNTLICPCCNMPLHQEIRKKNYLIDRECGYCSYSNERFFMSSSSGREKHYPNGCSCKYVEKDYLYMSCENCKSSKCIKCKNSLNCCNKNCCSVICLKCDEKIEFINFWKTKTPQEILYLYGIVKLKILANNKKIKEYSKYKKHELINILLPLVNEYDFPIKSE